MRHAFHQALQRAVFRRPKWRLAVRFRRFLWLLRTIKSFRPDVMHLHHREGFAIAALARKFSIGRPFSLVYHRHMELSHRGKHDAYHRFLYKEVELLITITERIRDKAGTRIPLGDAQLKALHYGINPAPAASAIQICERDYFDDLLASAERRGISDRIRHIGLVDDPQASMVCCNIVVHTAHIEAFGLVIAEAMASGAAEVAARSGGVPEIVTNDDAGLLYAPGDTDGLVAQLDRLIDNPGLRRRLASHGRAHVAERFSMEAHYDKLEALMSDAAARVVGTQPA